MKCFGSYDNDRICGLCGDLHKCIDSTKKRKESKELDVVMKFIGKHCKYAVEYYAEGEDRIGCALDECEDGYYGNCVPFEYSCPLRKSEV